MKNKLMYLVAVLFAACVGFSSCSDDDDKVDETLTGTWNYGTKGDVYLDFKYAKDKIEIPAEIIAMLPESIQGYIPADGVPVATVETLLKPYAKQQMAKYFRGIEFVSDSELKILYTKDNEAGSIKTTYTVQGSVLSISTQSEEFKSITDNKIPAALSAISLNYFFKDGKLTIYLDTTTIKTVVAMLPAILPALGVNLPAEALTAIQNISNNITKLDFGAVLVR
ncbi:MULTISPECIES: hypothetical protein [Butyricimonas]|uniref:hypothetical protein n=1 Tax=Butyricimonas TaxID=574697 RepID=UPI0007FB4922|nr:MULTISPECIES: hypothetical protein [Butyricimonas]